MRSKAFMLIASAMFVMPMSVAQVGPQIPEPPGVQAGGEIEAQLAALARAYRQGPVRESVSIRVKNDRGKVSQSNVLIATDATSPRRMRLELGQLVITSEDKIVHATVKSDAGRYSEFSLPDGPLKGGLEKLFPWLALPQLVLADAGVPESELGDLGLDPRGRSDVRWRSSRVERGIGRTVLEGDVHGATIRLGIDRATGRLRTAEINIDEGDVRSIELTCRGLEPGDPAKWLVDVGGRARVDALSDLNGDGELVRVGHALPRNLLFFTITGTRWEEQSDQLSSVLIFTRFDINSLRDADVETRDAAFRDARRVLQPPLRLRDQLLTGSEGRYSVRCVPLVEEADMTTRMAALLFRVFDTEDNVAVPDKRNETVLLVESSGDFDPVLAGGLAAAVVIDKDRVVRGIFTVDEPHLAEKRVRATLDEIASR